MYFRARNETVKESLFMYLMYMETASVYGVFIAYKKYLK